MSEDTPDVQNDADFLPTTPGTLLTLEADPMGPDENAPYGYMVDPDTGERRPKKRAGRRRKAEAPPSVENLDKVTGGPDDDRPPQRPKKGKAAKETAPIPPFRAGPIASGVNKLYTRAGKVVRVWDRDIGSALIAIARKEGEDDTTVGEAWEEIARTNPRIRAFLLRLLEGSAWSNLFMAHLPVLLAVLMKEGIRSRLPFQGVLSAMLDPNEDGPSDMSQTMGGMTGADMNQMMQMAMSAFPNMMATMPRQPTESVIPGFWSNDEGTVPQEQPGEGP